MHRTSLIELLNRYLPSLEEKIFQERMINFIKQYEQCFERSLEIGHFTGSAWIINKDNTKALLMHHAKLDRWFQLGGHCDGNPDVLAVALTEAQEESGIVSIAPVSGNIFDIDIHLIPENKKEKAHYHYDVRFLLQVTSDEQIIQNRESKELRWIGKNLEELPTDNSSVVRMFNKWIANYNNL
ncbi:MAG: NUDIX hydrolase [Candidatus Babeliales bacterium]